MEVSPHGDLGRDLGIYMDRGAGLRLLFFSHCSYSALRAPAVPGAARGKPPGEEGTAPATLRLLTPVFLTEPEGDAADHPAEGPLHPHRCRWGSPQPLVLSAQGWAGGGLDGENQCSFCCW